MLSFRVAKPIWDAETDSVFCFAGDDGRVVIFTVSRQVLTSIDVAASLSDPLEIFDKHLLRIRDVARRVYQAKGPSGKAGAYEDTRPAGTAGVYELTEKDFSN